VVNPHWAALPPEKNPGTPLDRGLGGPRSGPEVLGEEKSLGPWVQLAHDLGHQHI